MTLAVRAEIEKLGRPLTAEMLAETRRLFGADYAGLSADTQITRDLAYGPDPRHRFDLFTQQTSVAAPVLVYVHGGGFVMGDKHVEGSPFFSNVGDFAARQGWVGVTITYRLAPQHRFPSGPEDLAQVIEWLQANVARFGGDPARIVLWGQSAGAAHVAAYVAHRRFHVGDGGRLAGAIMMSGIYDLLHADPDSYHRAYYGGERGGWGPASMQAGLIASPIPQLFTVSEFDDDAFHAAAAHLAAAWTTARREYPRLHYLAGHNHLSPPVSLGSSVHDVENVVGEFVNLVAS